MKWLVSLFFSFSLLGGSPVQAISGGVEALTSEEKAVHDAASIQDPRRREDALRNAIRDGLLSVDPTVRDRVFSYLSQNSRWLDLRPYADLIEQFARTDSLHRGLWLLDDNELAHASRGERLAVYRVAIENGVTRLGRGRPLTRESAMGFAASEGMTEVEPLTVRFSADVEARWRKSFGFEAFPTLYALGRGAANREDALRLASQRLAAMTDEEVKAKMDGDAGFCGAVLQVARGICASDPFSGRRNPGCADMKRVIGRQMALERDARGIQRESSQRSPSGGDESTENWLSRLRQHVPDAEIVKPGR